MLQSGRTRLGGLYVLQKYGHETNLSVRRRVAIDLDWWAARLKCWVQETIEPQTMPIINASSVVDQSDTQMVVVQTDASGPDGRGGYYGRVTGTTAQYWSKTWSSEELPLRENSHAAELQALLDFVRLWDTPKQLILWVTDSSTTTTLVVTGASVSFFEGISSLTNWILCKETFTYSQRSKSAVVLASRPCQSILHIFSAPSG